MSGDEVLYSDLGDLSPEARDQLVSDLSAAVDAPVLSDADIDDVDALLDNLDGQDSLAGSDLGPQFGVESPEMLLLLVESSLLVVELGKAGVVGREKIRQRLEERGQPVEERAVEEVETGTQ